MITRTNISTISYNTDSFLIRTLEKLRSEGVIYFWAFVQHFPEDDERKMHKHLFVVPSSTLDTFQLDTYMQEIDDAHPDLPPLRCKMWCRSQFPDWYMYVLHDKDYLVHKGIERKYHYTIDDIICSDKDDLLELIHRSDFSNIKYTSKFRDMIASGVSFAELVKNGFVPIQQIEQYSKAYDLFKYGDLYYSKRYHFGRDAGKREEEKEEYMPFVINEDGEYVPRE